MTDENIEARTGTTEVKPTAGMPDWLLPDRVYDVLKWVALIVLPAMATLVQAPSRPRHPRPNNQEAPEPTANACGMVRGLFVVYGVRRGRLRGDAWCAAGRRSMC